MCPPGMSPRSEFNTHNKQTALSTTEINRKPSRNSFVKELIVNKDGH